MIFHFRQKASIFSLGMSICALLFIAGGIILPCPSCVKAGSVELWPDQACGTRLFQIGHAGEIFEVRIAGDHLSLLFTPGRIDDRIGHA